MAKRKCELMAETLRGTTEYSEIREDLLNQLKMNQTTGKFYTDMIEDYMDLWVTKNMLLEDIRKRGVTVRYNNGGGQSGYKKNDSIEQVLKVNTQMLKILDGLEIRPSTSVGEENEEL